MRACGHAAACHPYTGALRASVRPAVPLCWAYECRNAARRLRSPPRCSRTAISTSVRAESEISGVASSRGLVSSTMVEVTRLVTVFAVSRASWGLPRLLVPVTSL